MLKMYHVLLLVIGAIATANASSVICDATDNTAVCTTTCFPKQLLNLTLVLSSNQTSAVVKIIIVERSIHHPTPGGSPYNLYRVATQSRRATKSRYLSKNEDESSRDGEEMLFSEEEDNLKDQPEIENRADYMDVHEKSISKETFTLKVDTPTFIFIPDTTCKCGKTKLFIHIELFTVAGLKLNISLNLQIGGLIDIATTVAAEVELLL